MRLSSRSTYSEESPGIIIWARWLFPGPDPLPNPGLMPPKPGAALGPDAYFWKQHCSGRFTAIAFASSSTSVASVAPSSSASTSPMSAPPRWVPNYFIANSFFMTIPSTYFTSLFFHHSGLLSCCECHGCVASSIPSHHNFLVILFLLSHIEYFI